MVRTLLFRLSLVLLLLVPFTYAIEYSDGYMTFESNKNGFIKINDQKLGFAIKGKINNQTHIATSADFDWNFSRYWYHEFYNDENETNTTVVPYTIEVWTAYNNYPRFNWTIELVLHPVEDHKIKHILTNDLGVDITNGTFWYIFEVDQGRLRLPNGTRFDFSNNIHLEGSYNDKISRYDMGSFTFLFQDLIDDNFNITEIYVGDGSILGLNKRLVGLGVTKGNGVLRDGNTITLDPTMSEWKFPTVYGEHIDQWTNTQNVLADDNTGATETTLSHTFSSGRYGFDEDVVPDNAIIHEVGGRVKHRSQSGTCTTTGRWRVSRDNYTSFSNVVHYEGHKGVGYDIELIKDSPYYPLWNFTDWTTEHIRDGNLTVETRFHTSKLCFGAWAYDIDYIQFRINWSYPLASVSFIDNTPADSSIISSTLTVNITSDVPLLSGLLEENSSGEWLNHTLLQGENTSIWYYYMGGEEGADDGLSFDFRVWGLTGGGYNNSNTRTVTVSSALPAVFDNSLLNATTISTVPATISFNISDPNSDLLDVFIYARNDTDLYESIVHHDRLVGNSTVTYNLTNYPIPYDSEYLQRLYHMDNLVRHGVPNNNLEIFDTAGNYNGSIDGANLTTGYFVNGYEFDGVDDQIVIGDGEELKDVCFNGCTLSAWVNMDLTTDETLHLIVGRYDLSNNDFYVTLLIQEGNNANFSSFSVTEDGRNFVLGGRVCSAGDTSYNSIFNGTWHLITGVYDSENYTRLYTDGVLMDNQSCSFELNHTEWLDNTEDFRLGMGDYDPKRWAKGIIDEVGVWNRSLTSEEISQMYELGDGTYYWNSTVQDRRNYINSTAEQFDITLCTYDCSTTNFITSGLDCLGNDLIFLNSGAVEIDANFTGINRIIGSDCRISIYPGHTIE